MPFMLLSDDELIARLLIDTWTLTTGKTLRGDVPPHELTEEELIDFWSDDRLKANTGSARLRDRETVARKGPPGWGETAIGLDTRVPTHSAAKDEWLHRTNLLGLETL